MTAPRNGTRLAGRGSWCRYAAAVLVTVVAGLLATTWTTGGASAHAVLEEIAPADGAIIERSPPEVTLTFDEPVSLSGGFARVLDDAGNDISIGADVTDAVVTVSLPEGLDDGTYVTTWRLISQDSHPVGGTSVFHINEPSAAADTLLSSLDTGEAAGAPTWLRAAGTAATAALYAAALGAAGAWWFGRFVAGVRRGEVTAARLRRIVTALATIGLGAALVSLPLRIARLGGRASALGDGDFVRDAATGPIGAAMAVSGAGLVVLLVARWHVAGAAGSVLAVAGFAIEGHTRTQDPQWAMIGFDLVHVIAAAAWFGGLAGVIVLLRHETDSASSAAAVARFSRVASGAVVAAAAAGTGMAVIVLPEPSALFGTGYGLALVVKVALVAVAVGLGGMNRRRVGAVAGAGEPGGREPAPSRTLWNAVRVEVVVLLTVVAATAVLVGRSPSPASDASSDDLQAGANGGPVSVEVELSGDGDGQETLGLGVTPATIGDNELWLELTGPAGQPLAPREPPSVELRERSRDLGPLRPDVHDLGDGATYHSYVEIPLAGRWEVLVRVRVDDFTSVSGSTTVDIGG